MFTGRQKIARALRQSPSREDPRGSETQYIYFPRTRKGRTRSHANALSVDELFGIHDICPVLGREHPDRQGIHSNHRSEDVLAPVELPRVPHLGELWRGERTPNENTLSQEARVTKGSDDRPGTVVRRVRATRTSASEHTRAQRPLSGVARVAAAVLFSDGHPLEKSGRKRNRVQFYFWTRITRHSRSKSRSLFDFFFFLPSSALS